MCAKAAVLALLNRDELAYWKMLIHASPTLCALSLTQRLSNLWDCLYVFMHKCIILHNKMWQRVQVRVLWSGVVLHLSVCEDAGS